MVFVNEKTFNKISIVYSNNSIIFVYHLKQNNMYTVFNHVEGRVVFMGNESELIEFVKKIVIKNEDFDYSVLGVSDAIEYIDDYCSDIDLVN